MNVLRMFDLSGKTAIITGGGRGLGTQIALGLAEAGANIVLCSRKVEACQEVADSLGKEYGVQTLALKCDIGNAVDIQNVVKETLNKFECIDILVNNSGISWGAPSLDMPLEAWNKVININLTGTFLMSQAVGKVMVEQKRGKIINIASVAGLGGTHTDMMDTIGYNASKGAVITLTKDLAVKWGKYNIHVNAIAPGFFLTKMSQVLLERGKDALEYLTPLGRLGNDQDLKGVVLFLASDASNYITGEVLVVDGGKHAMV
jgi:NAD(P)-dependent dehydrogenase (short-subunit alcohol dehydrogenase family)